MVDYGQMADKYAELFPNISKEDHLMIIQGALEFSEERSPPMCKDGFENWYSEVAPKLDQHQEILDEIRENPHGVMHREAMILGRDCMDTPISERVKLEVALA